MTRQEMLLALLAATGGKALSFTHLQHAIFAFHKAKPECFDRPDEYRFLYTDRGGPFSRSVYTDIHTLKQQGLVETDITGKPRICRATETGLQCGRRLLEALDPATAQDIINNALFLIQQSSGEIIALTRESFFEKQEAPEDQPQLVTVSVQTDR